MNLTKEEEARLDRFCNIAIAVMMVVIGFAAVYAWTSVVFKVMGLL